MDGATAIEPGRMRDRDPASRIRRHNEAIILDAAEQVFAEAGYATATMAAIAGRAGLPKANLHYWFGSKEALYRAVLRRILELWLSALPPIAEDDDPREALTAYVRAKMHHSRVHSGASRIFALEVIKGGAEIRTFLEGDLREWVEVRAAVIRAWQAQGRMAAVDPVHLLFMIWAMTQHWADFAPQILAVTGRDSLTAADYDRATGSVTAVLLGGCGL